MLTVFWLISPTEKTAWRIDRDWLIEILKRDWPGISVSGPDPGLATRDVIWEVRASDGTLEGSQDREGRAQYLDGPTAIVSRYAAWLRAQVSRDHALSLYDEGYNTLVPLIAGISVDEVEARIGGAR